MKHSQQEGLCRFKKNKRSYLEGMAIYNHADYK